MTDANRVQNLADQHGFPLGSIEEAGDVLILEPTALEALPDAETLGALAEALKAETGHRYVTFSAAGPADENNSEERR